MLVERRRSALPFEFLARIAIAWGLVASVMVAVNWTTIAASLTRGLESAAFILIPLATLACIMLLAARIAWRLMGDEEATLAALIPALSIPVLFELAPLRIDDHGWQIICALVIVNALMARRGLLGGWAIGLACAVWLAISLEGAAVTLALMGILALRWWRSRDARWWLVGTAQSLALATSILFVSIQGLAGPYWACGAVNLAHVGAFAWAAVSLTLLARFEPLPAGLRLGIFALIAGGGAAISYYGAPQCMSAQWMPIWRESALMILQIAVTPLIGLVAAMNLAHSSRDWLRRYWGDYTLILVAAFVFALLYTPAGVIACVLAAPPLAWQVREWLRRIRLMRSMGPRSMATLALTCALLPSFPLIVFAAATQA